MDDVVSTSVEQQMPKDACPEHERWEEATAAAGVELELRPDRVDPDARNARVLAAWPLAERQVFDVVPVGREPFRQVPVPALGSADRVRVEAVVDETDAQGLQDRFTGGLQGCNTMPDTLR